MSEIYIRPNIIKYPSFKELLDDKKPFSYFSSSKGVGLFFENIVNLKRAFIITEPGYGKTRLLKEIVLQSSSINKQGIFIDLKKVNPAQTIEAYIQEKLDVIHKIADVKNIQKTTLFKTKDFDLSNSNKVVVCLDALDEVKHDDFTRITEAISDFSKRYGNIYLFVSCRHHHFQKYKYLFYNFTFDYLNIEPFTREQVYIYFQNHGIPDKHIDKIIHVLEFRPRHLVIQTPRYLEMMAILVKEKGPENIAELTKANLFEKFIYGKIELEEQKKSGGKASFIKRTLEQLALLMEISQTNVLAKEDLVTVFEELEFFNKLQGFSIEDFYDRTVLKDNIDTIEFENTEFQEYLAAKEILRSKKPEQVVFDLAVDQELREIFPSWFNTLSFLIDLDISLLYPILQFGASNLSPLQDESYHRFLTKVQVERLPKVIRKKIFEDVFMYYQNVLHWLPYDVARNLSYYFDSSLEKLLKKSIMNTKAGTTDFVKKGNIAYIVAFLIEHDDLSSSQLKYWQRKLIEFAKDDNKNGVLQRHTLFALGKMKDINLLKQVSCLRTSSDELIIQNFMEACMECNPNDKFSIQSFVEGCKKENIYARYGVYQIKEKKAVNFLLEIFAKDEQFLFQFIDQESIFKDKDHELIENIRKVYDKDIKNNLELIIIKAFSNKHWYHSENSRIIKSLVLLLSERDKNYIFKLISSIKKTAALQKHIFSMRNIFSFILKKDQVANFVKKLNEDKQNYGIAVDVLFQIGQSDRMDAEEVYEEGRTFFVKDYTKIEKNIRKIAKEPSKQLRTYTEFKYKLQPEENKYIPSVFRYYNNHKEQIDTLITVDDKKRLKDLVENSIFEKFDPGKQKLKISQKEDQNCSYTTHSWIHIFGDCLLIIKELDIDVSKYRKKIISYIPFAYSAHIQAIFSIISTLKQAEISMLIRIYNEKRKDDLAHFMPTSFIDAAKRYNIKEAVPILKRFVEQEDFQVYERCNALKTVALIRIEESYLKRIFNRYNKPNSKLFQLAEVANEYLIEKFQNKKAITWRLDELKRKATPFVTPKGGHFMSDFENELSDKKFARPLMVLTDSSYKKLFLSLLDYSFKNLKQGDEHWSYTTYLWDIVIVYFDNLKQTKSYVHLKELEQYIQNKASDIGLNWFKNKVKDLKYKYMEYLGKPKTIHDCLQQYNEIRKKKYLEVSNERDLYKKIKEVINDDIKKFVEEEGFYNVIQKASDIGEELIQKTLKTQIENGLLKRGVRDADINRENQLLDNKRLDYLISYGFIGPILIEIKRSDNKEITSPTERIKYKTKLLQYIVGSKSKYGIFIIFQIKKDFPLNKYLPDLQKIYKDCPQIDIIGMNCLKS